MDKVLVYETRDSGFDPQWSHFSIEGLMDKALVHETDSILYDDFQRRFVDSTVP